MAFGGRWVPSKDRGKKVALPATLMGLCLAIAFFSCSANQERTSATAMQEQEARLASPNQACIDELEAAIHEMTDIHSVRLSGKAFSEQSLLVLSNYQPEETTSRKDGHPMPLRPGEYRFRLSRDSRGCRISRIDDGGQTLDTRPLKACGCR